MGGDGSRHLGADRQRIYERGGLQGEKKSFLHLVTFNYTVHPRHNTSGAASRFVHLESYAYFLSSSFVAVLIFSIFDHPSLGRLWFIIGVFLKVGVHLNRSEI